jgi:diketogulonate reductase-like aldo/keto reductase
MYSCSKRLIPAQTAALRRTVAKVRRIHVPGENRRSLSTGLDATQPQQVNRSHQRPQTGWPDFRNTLPRFKPGNRKANQTLVDLLARVGGRKKSTPAQIALARLLAQKAWIVLIPGAAMLHRLEEHIRAVDIERTPDDYREINSAASKIAVQGARHSEHLERMTGRWAAAKQW